MTFPRDERHFRCIPWWVGVAVMNSFLIRLSMTLFARIIINSVRFFFFATVQQTDEDNWTLSSSTYVGTDFSIAFIFYSFLFLHIHLACVPFSWPFSTIVRLSYPLTIIFMILISRDVHPHSAAVCDKVLPNIVDTSLVSHSDISGVFHASEQSAVSMRSLLSCGQI